MNRAQIRNRPEEFKLGWVAGLYDAKSDDGLRYRNNVLVSRLPSANDRSFLAGYRAAQKKRLGYLRWQ